MSVFNLLMVALTTAQSPIRPEPPKPNAQGVEQTLVAVGAERTVAEFMDICFRPRWNVDSVRAAVKASDLVYVEGTTSGAEDIEWTSRYAGLHFIITPDFSQCELAMGSIQPRTGEQLLAILKPAIEAELGHDVQENGERFYLEWTEPDGVHVDRVTMDSASKSPDRAFDFLFDRSAPGARERLDALYPPPKPQH